MYDKLLTFSNAQVIADTAEVESTYSVDLGNVTPKRQVGVGKPLFLEVWATTTGATCNGQVLTIELMTAAGATTIGGTVLDSTTYTLAGSTSALIWQVQLPMSGLLQHIGLTYNSDGNPNSTLAITAALTDAPAAWQAYDSALVVT